MTTISPADAIALCDAGLERDLTNHDCSPRFETLLNQHLYLGIWCYSNTDEVLFALEVNSITGDGRDHVWFEDAHIMRSVEDFESRIYATFDEAMRNLGKIVDCNADRSPV